jgi:choice-of-anchor B domain-containing protein
MNLMISRPASRSGFPRMRRVPRRLHVLLVICILAIGSVAHGHDQAVDAESESEPAAQEIPCLDGMAGEYPCFNVDLVHYLPLDTFGAVRANDIWGWTDPLTGFEYAILGLGGGTAFLRIEEDGHPHYLGLLPTRSFNSIWRDMKVYRNHAFIVSEAPLHGMQVFDLTRLRDLDLAGDPVTFASDTDYVEFSRAHNLAINEETGYAYAVGTDTCSGGLHMVDIREPKQPVFSRCFGNDNYTHDAQCVIYHGPDPDYFGREICFNSNEDTLTIVDVTDKTSPFRVARVSYTGHRYAHQGWLTEDHAYFLLGDELDEYLAGKKTTTIVWDTSNLDAPYVTGTHVADSSAIDHNQYVRGNHVFQANYRSGIRILRLGDLSQAEMTEVAFFDTIPGDDSKKFTGAWSVYPFFESGLIVASDIFRGFYVLRPDLAAVPECSDGIDNDRDGLRDYPEDRTCISDDAVSEEVRFDVALERPRAFASRPIVLPSQRYLSLVVLGSETVDVLDLDFDSLLFHPGDVAPIVLRWWGNVWTLDLNRDGWRDVVLFIPLSKSTLAPGDKSVCITGLLSDDAFEACTEVTVIQRTRPKARKRHRKSRHHRHGYH